MSLECGCVQSIRGWQESWEHAYDQGKSSRVDPAPLLDFCMRSDEHHCRALWECCFPDIFGEASFSGMPLDAQRDRLAEVMLGVIPQCMGGDVIDWEKGDESETTVHNMVSTSVVHGSDMPINLSQLAVLLPCSTYDRKKFAAITIRIDEPRCTALLFTSGKLVITGVKSW